MSRPMDEFFAEVEAEFGVDIGGQRDVFDTPGDVIEYLAAEAAPADGMDDEERPSSGS